MINTYFAQNYPTWVAGINTATCSVKNFTYSPGPCSYSTGVGVCKFDFGDGSAIQTLPNQTLGSNSTTHNFPNGSSTIYTVTVSAYTNSISSTACETASCNVFVNCGTNPACQASITAYQSTLACNNVNFVNSSVGNGTIYKWNFGDGSSLKSSNYNINHIYPNTIGMYTVTLNMYMATDTINACSSTTKTIAVNCVNNSNALFSATQFTSGCNNYIFHNASTGSGNYYKWKYGDGTIDYNANSNFQHNYPIATATYTATLYKYASAVYGSPAALTFLCDSFQQVITISCNLTPTCNAAFSTTQYTTGCNDILFINNSSSNGSGYNLWKFGDGGTATYASNSFVHTYPLGSGTYTASLYKYISIPTGGYYLCDSANQIININCTSTPTCQANLSITQSTASCNSYYFYNSSSSGFSSSHNINFGDGTFTLLPPNSGINHTYTTIGNYTATLNINSNTGNTVTPICSISQSIAVSCIPTTTCNANFNYTTSSHSAFFTASNAGSGAIYVWNFGNSSGTTTSSLFANSVYSSYGTYVVTLNVYLSSNTITPCSSSTQTITLNSGSICQAAFSYTPNVNCNNVYLVNNSTGVGNTYKWDFGDGNTSNSSSIYLTHQYTTNGNYSINLDVFSPTDTINPCSSLQHTIAINCPTLNCQATSNFNLFADTLNPGQYFAYNTSSGNGTLTYLWDFGDGTTSTQQYPFHQYATLGQYIVCLEVTATSGTTTCTDTYCDSSSVQRMASGFQMSSINVIQASATGIKTLNKQLSIIAYPNPFSDELTFEVELTGYESKLHYHLFDALGKTLREDIILSSKTMINTSDLSAGFYYISIKNNNESTLKTIKIIK